MRKVLIIFFFLGLVYILAPGPSSIDDFPPIPGSLKSDEPGDTVQVPNVAAYFSDYDRSQITKFYKESYRNSYFFGLVIPPVSLNYPPIAAYQYVRDLLQLSTFLEEYSYPLKGSLFVNGYEQIVMRKVKGLPPKEGPDQMQIKGQFFDSKTTIRYYPVDLFNSLVVYLGIWMLALSLYFLAQRIFREKLL